MTVVWRVLISALLPVNGLGLSRVLTGSGVFIDSAGTDDAEWYCCLAPLEKPISGVMTLVEKMRKYNLQRKEKDFA